MAYQLYYWPGLQGRGEFVRLALEAAGAPYTDVGRGETAAGQGIPALLQGRDLCGIAQTDAVSEAHNTHHPVGVGLYYEDQLQEAAKAARTFRTQRIPKFLGWLETVLERNPKGDKYLVGA